MRRQRRRRPPRLKARARPPRQRRPSGPARRSRPSRHIWRPIRRSGRFHRRSLRRPCLRHRRFRKHDLGRAQPRQFLGQQRLQRRRAGRAQLTDAEHAGAQVGGRQPGDLFAAAPAATVAAGAAPRLRRPGHRRAVVRRTALQQRRLQRRARRDHPHHAPRHQALAGARVLQLLADRHAMPAPHQPRQVLIDALHRHAGQRHPQPLAHGFAGQHDLQLAADQLRVAVEGLVEVAQPEKQDRVRVASLDLQVLSANG